MESIEKDSKPIDRITPATGGLCPAARVVMPGGWSAQSQLSLTAFAVLYTSVGRSSGPAQVDAASPAARSRGSWLASLILDLDIRLRVVRVGPRDRSQDLVCGGHVRARLDQAGMAAVLGGPLIAIVFPA